MKIISRFTDYYDKVAWTYGGGDPKVRYERHDFDSDELGATHNHIAMKIEYRDIMAPLSVTYHRELHNRYDQRLMIVGERVYTVFRETDWMPRSGQLWAPWFLPDEAHEIITKGDRMYSKNWKKDGPSILHYKSSDAIELCKRVGQPVLWIAHQYYTAHRKWSMRSKHFIEIAREVPRLCEIKNFARFYPADQIYQDLAYVIGNLMHNPPDADPPVQVEEKIRLQKKGFDLKTSFRGKEKKEAKEC